MQISSVSHSQAAAPPRLTAAQVTAAAVKAVGPQKRLTLADVPTSLARAAAGDGDGRYGTAALNDGDAASQAARRGAIDVKA